MIPAVFAAVFGPRVGALGAGIGIFIGDMMIHGNAVLTLMAGVPSNLVMFAIIGYMANRKTGWKTPLIVLGCISAFLVGVSYVVLLSPPYGLGYQLLAMAIVIGTYVVLTILVWLTKWKGYVLGSTLRFVGGQLHNCCYGAFV